MGFEIIGGEWIHRCQDPEGKEFRCPHCGTTHDADRSDPRLYSEGDMTYLCSACNKINTVYVTAIWTWTSPALKEK